jgi:hypothetical protein
MTTQYERNKAIWIDQIKSICKIAGGNYMLVDEFPLDDPTPDMVTADFKTEAEMKRAAKHLKQYELKFECMSYAFPEGTSYHPWGNYHRIFVDVPIEGAGKTGGVQ